MIIVLNFINLKLAVLKWKKRLSKIYLVKKENVEIAKEKISKKIRIFISEKMMTMLFANTA
jgi:hypothetical protein